MGALLLLTSSSGSTAAPPAADVIPSLGLLSHRVRCAPLEAAALLDAGLAGGSNGVDAVLVDARRDLVTARSLCRLLRTTGLTAPLMAVVTEGGLAAVAADWGIDEVLLADTGPAELDARLRLSIGRAAANRDQGSDGVTRAGELVVDETTYAAKLRGRPLDLTFKEFELLKYLAQHPGRVFSRAQLLQEVWGYDYYGGTRTVDVHVRRLRAKLGVEHEGLIGTVRHVGYKFVTPAIIELPEAGSGAVGIGSPEPSERRVPVVVR